MAARRADTPPPSLRLVRDDETPPAPLTSESFCFGRKGVRVAMKTALQFVLPRAVAFLADRAPRPRPDPNAPCLEPARDLRLDAHRQLLLHWRTARRTVPSRKRKSLGNEPITRKERELSRKLQIWRLPQLPKTYGDCMGRARPCYFFRCRYNLYLDVNPGSGSIVLNFPGKEPHELEYTCAIDAALEGAPADSDRGAGHTLERLGEFLNVNLERARQTEAEALLELRAKLEDMPRDFGTDEVDEFEEDGD